MAVFGSFLVAKLIPLVSVRRVQEDVEHSLCVRWKGAIGSHVSRKEMENEIGPETNSWLKGEPSYTR